MVLALLLLSVSPALQLPGLPHAYQVDGRVYRGAQPTAAGWDSLAKLGVKTVIDLRRDGEAGEHSTAAEAKAVEAAGMRYVNVPLKGFSAPTGERIARILALLESPGPVFVHCQKGKDRTGTVIACYRIAHDGWSNQKALAEAKSLGLHWFEHKMKRYILRYRPPVTPLTSPVTR